MTAQILPHPALCLHSCDTVAECFNGVVRDDDWSLYNALWKAMEEAPPLSELIDIEDSCPADALGLNTPAEYWNRFTPEQQQWLNEVAGANAA